MVDFNPDELDRLEPSDYVNPNDVFKDDEFAFARIPLLCKDNRGRVHSIYGTKKMHDGTLRPIGGIRVFK